MPVTGPGNAEWPTNAGQEPPTSFVCPTIQREAVVEKNNTDKSNKSGCLGPLVFVALLATAGVLVNPGTPGLSQRLEEHYIWPFTPEDCPTGWNAQKVDPVKLAHGFDEVYPYIVTAYNHNKSTYPQGVPYDPYSDTIASQNRAIDYSFNDLEGLSWIYGRTEKLDESVEVACSAPGGGYMASAEAQRALVHLEQAGYTIDTMTGVVAHPGN